MAYVTAEARQELADSVADAAGQLGTAVAALGAAYEALDEDSADRLEEVLFRPVQLAYGRARKTATSFAERTGVSVPEVVQALEAGNLAVPVGHVTGALDERTIRLQGRLDTPGDFMQAVVAERLRIARELPDVVAHHVSVMGVQADDLRFAQLGVCCAFFGFNG